MKAGLVILQLKINAACTNIYKGCVDIVRVGDSLQRWQMDPWVVVWGWRQETQMKQWGATFWLFHPDVSGRTPNYSWIRPWSSDPYSISPHTCFLKLPRANKNSDTPKAHLVYCQSVSLCRHSHGRMLTYLFFSLFSSLEAASHDAWMGHTGSALIHTHTHSLKGRRAERSLHV